MPTVNGRWVQPTPEFDALQVGDFVARTDPRGWSGHMVTKHKVVEKKAAIVKLDNGETYTKAMRLYGGGRDRWSRVPYIEAWTPKVEEKLSAQVEATRQQAVTRYLESVKWGKLPVKDRDEIYALVKQRVDQVETRQQAEQAQQVGQARHAFVGKVRYVAVKPE